MIPEDLNPGEIWDLQPNYHFGLVFIESVSKAGVHLCVMGRPVTYPPSKSRATSVTYYSKLAGHDSVIPFSSSYWTKETDLKRWKLHGKLPALIGQKSIKLEA